MEIEQIFFMVVIGLGCLLYYGAIYFFWSIE